MNQNWSWREALYTLDTASLVCGDSASTENLSSPTRRRSSARGVVSAPMMAPDLNTDTTTMVLHFIERILRIVPILWRIDFLVHTML